MECPRIFYSIDLMNAYEQLGTIIGEAVEDDPGKRDFQQILYGKIKAGVKALGKRARRGWILKKEES